MNIEIKKLVPELAKEYIDFFDNIAFTDNEEWAGCYCVYYHWNDRLEEECKKYEEANEASFRRELAMRYIQEGTLQGYLAYSDGVVVGWCNANDKSRFDALSKGKRPDLWDDYDGSAKVKLIVCYTIAPDMRHKGIATQLLKKVCEDAAAEGYTYVEAYPGKGEENIQRNYHGPYTLYQKFGFEQIKDLNGEAIVRKYL